MNNFRFSIPYQIHVADINYGGHLANSAVLNIFQDARIAYLAELGPFSELDLGGYGLILPEAHVYFRAEMFLHQELNVWVRCRELKRSSFTLSYRLERNQVLTAEGETVQICFDYQRRKTRRIPAEFRQALTEYEGL